MNFSLRRATPADAAMIAATGAAVWIATYAVESVQPVYADYVLAQFTLEKARVALGDAGTHFWVAAANDGIVGYAELRLGAKTAVLSAARQAEIARLYVLERFARRGIGRALLRRCTDDARAHGAEGVWLSVYSENRRALDFYRALGWQHVGDTGFLLGGVEYPNHVFALR
jgi:diamine N-acetyltransferase